MKGFRIIHIVFPFVVALAAFVSANNDAKCTTPEGQAICCSNYFRRDDGSCHPCENGTYGINCKFRCPRFHYGRFCEGECNCSNGTDCDPRNGKCGLDTIDIEVETFPIWTIAVAAIGVIVIFVGLLGCCLAFQRGRQPTSNDKDLTDVQDILDLLSRRAFNLESESNDYRGTTTDRGENGVTNTNNNSSYHYIDTSLLDINPRTQHNVPRLEIVEARQQGDLDHSDHESDSNIPIGKAWSGSHTLPARANAPPFFGTIGMYHSIENLAPAYDTLTRCGPQKADLPPLSGFLTRNLEHSNSEKLKGFVKVRKWRNKPKEATEDDSSRNKVDRRRKSRALSNIRKGIRSVFRSSKASLEINSIANDGSHRDVYRYSVVQHPSDTCSTDGNLREECSLAIMNIDADRCNISNQSVGNTADATGGQLPPPPDEWLSENCSARLIDGSYQENGDEPSENKRNNSQDLNLVSGQAGSIAARKDLLQKCHITKFAANNESINT